jgi:hypothetical protein
MQISLLEIFHDSILGASMLIINPNTHGSKFKDRTKKV